MFDVFIVILLLPVLRLAFYIFYGIDNQNYFFVLR